MKRVFSSYYFVFFVAMAATQPFLSLYLHNRGISSEHIGFILACGNGAGILVQPLLGHLNDVIPDSRRLLLLSAIVSPIIFAGYAISRNIFILLSVAALFAVAQSSGPLADAMTVHEAERSGFTYGQIRLWGALSFALTTMIAGYVYHLTGISLAFGLYAVFSILLATITWKLPKSRAASHASEAFWKGIWNVTKNARLLVFIVICFFVASALTMNTTYLPLYFQALHHPMALVGLNFTVAALTEVPLFYLSGKWMARFGKMPILILATATLAVKYAVMAMNPPTAVILSIQVLDGVGYALYWSAAVQVVNDLAPSERSGTAQTLYAAIAGSLSGIVGTSAGGFVFAQFGPLVTYVVITSSVLVAFVGFIAFARFGMRQAW
ncbi:MFS transporter [Alicyclobacillus ferrooxydans]|uniref:Major facilitator superfamily (MFS) profile domain-containing protein n=1 Tax=Alicyclobacillus ferrooxydans TaxID=471514 RepID=A0A0P9GSC1_9BACL|nr:MFS transporter [Alicyclobacillus ferrooxydans]KPV43926.1 hypothetical protein AN477_09360 [Alicyclobacillus ferrooxydans]